MKTYCLKCNCGGREGKYCFLCGEKLTEANIKCSKCGEWNYRKNEFCVSCGTKLTFNQNEQQYI